MSTQIITAGGDTSLRNRPVQLRGQERLRKILGAAVDLYNDPAVGRDRLTTGMVAEKAGCSIGTFYRYFTDRVALFDAIAPRRDVSPAGTTTEARKVEGALAVVDRIVTELEGMRESETYHVAPHIVRLRTVLTAAQS